MKKVHHAHQVTPPIIHFFPFSGQFILQLYGPFALGKDPRYRDDNGDEENGVPETLDPGVLKGENILNLPIGSLKSPQNAKTDRSKLNNTFLPQKS